MSPSRFKCFALSAFLLVVLVAGSVSADEPVENPVESRLVGVMFDSRPNHAEVWIGGKFVGTTPMNYRLAPGDHTISLSRLRYSKWTRELTIASGIATRVTAILEAAEHDGGPCKPR